MGIFWAPYKFHFHFIIFELFSRSDWYLFSTLGGAWACQRQSCRIGRIFLLEWHEPVLASGSQDGSGDGRHQRGHDELSGRSIWRGQRVRPWKRGEHSVLFELQAALNILKKFRLWWWQKIWNLNTFFRDQSTGLMSLPRWNTCALEIWRCNPHFIKAIVHYF